MPEINSPAGNNFAMEGVDVRFHPRPLHGVQNSKILDKLNILGNEAVKKRHERGESEFKNTTEKIAQINIKTQDIQAQTMEILGTHNPELEEYLEGLSSTKSAIEKIREDVKNGSWEQQELLESIKGNTVLNLLNEQRKQTEGKNVSDFESEISIGFTRRDARRVERACGRILAKVSDSSFQWQLLSEKGFIPKELTEEITGLMDMMEVYKITEAIENSALNSPDKKAIKAYSLLPFIEKGVNAGFIEDIVEGRFEFDETFFDTIVENIGKIEEISEDLDRDAVKGRSKLGKKAGLAITAGVLAVAGISYFSQTQYQDYNVDRPIVSPSPISIPSPTATPTPLPTESGPKKPSPILKSKPGHVQAGKTPAIESSRTSGLTGDAAEKGIKDKVNKEEAAKPDDSGMRPKESARIMSAEDFIELSQIKVWDIEGDPNDIRGLYKTGTGSKFDGKDWVANDAADMYPSFYSARAEKSDIAIKKKIQLKEMFSSAGNSYNAYFDIPVHDGYFVNTADISVKSVKDQHEVKWEVFYYKNGSYRFIITSNEDPSEVDVRIGQAKMSQYNLNNLSQDAYKRLMVPDAPNLDDWKKLFDSKRMPDGDVKQKLDYFTAAVPIRENARKFEDWWKYAGIYSLDPRWSDYYTGGDKNDYFYRLFDKKRGTCIVSNTGLVGALREMGIPARIVFGYKNNGEAMTPSSGELRAGSRHAWVEAYFDEWVVFDGTAVNLDDEAKKALEQLQELGLAPQVPEVGGLPNFVSTADEDNKFFGEELGDGEGSGEGEGLGGGNTVKRIEEFLEKNQEIKTAGLRLLTLLALGTAGVSYGVSVERLKGYRREMSKRYKKFSGTAIHSLGIEEDKPGKNMTGIFHKLARDTWSTPTRPEAESAINALTAPFRPIKLGNLIRYSKRLREMEERGRETKIEYLSGIPQAMSVITGVPLEKIEERILRSNRRETERELVNWVNESLYDTINSYINSHRIRKDLMPQDYEFLSASDVLGRMRLFGKGLDKKAWEGEFEDFYMVVVKDLYASIRAAYIEEAKSYAKMEAEKYYSKFSPRRKKRFEKRIEGKFFVPPDDEKSMQAFAEKNFTALGRPLLELFKN